MTKYEKKFGKRDGTAYCPCCFCVVPTYHVREGDVIHVHCMKCRYWEGGTTLFSYLASSLVTPYPQQAPEIENVIDLDEVDLDEVLDRMNRQAGR
jgi:hypothetical protein